MKKGWTYKKLGEVFKTYAGGTPSKANKANYINGTIPWLRSGEVCKKYITESELYISEEGLRNSSAKYYPINTVLIAMYGATAAQCGILKFEATSNQAVCGVLPQKDFLPEFVYSYFVYIKDALAAQAQGGAQPNISQEKIKNVYFPCIPLSEQKLIVSRLDAAFSHIDELKANAEKQLSEARALFQKSLAKALEPKEDWKFYHLQDICTDVVDCPHTTPRKVDKPTIYPCIRTSELRGGQIDWKTMQYLDEEEYKKRTTRIIPKENDIVYGREGTYGDAALLPKGYCFSLGQRTMLLRPNVDLVYPEFLLNMLISTHVYEQAKAKNSGCGVGHVNVKDIKVFNIYIPPLSEQQRIVERLDALSAHVRELEENQKKIISECDALKQALLRKVFE